MKSFKSHISVIFPLFVLLFSIEFSTLVGKIIQNYEFNMNSDYNIIVVSQNKLDEKDIKMRIRSFKSISLLETKSVLDRLKEDISATNLATLSSTLPQFYSIKLTKFPNTSTMKTIKDRLMDINGVKRVETFAKTHDKVYKILVISKSIFNYFMALIIVLGVILIFKQMKIWLFEHKRRVEIMTLFGAPYWSKSAMLYKLAVIDSFLATFFVGLFYAVAPKFGIFDDISYAIGINTPDLNLAYDCAKLFAISMLVSIIAVSFVMLYSKEQKQ